MKLLSCPLHRQFLTLLLILSVIAPGLLIHPSVAVAQISREPARASRGMVVSATRLASEAGVDVLKRGGNAVDAAVAVAFALAVTYPSAGNLGGGGFMLIRLSDGRTTTLDYRETAPAGASRNMYLNQKGDLIEGEGSSTRGYRAVGVPGTVAGLDLALRKYGTRKLSWSQLIEPARRLAAEGFPLSYVVTRSLEDSRTRLELYDDSRRIFLNNGKLFKEGDLLRLPELGATLARLQKNGAREFYEGQTARLISEDMKRHNGLITLADLRGYAPKEREPITGTYRGHKITSMAPPSSGGVALIQMLNILEGYDLPAMGWSSAAKYHVTAEAMRRAFADRAEYLGDPDFTDVPSARLISKDYALALRQAIDLNRASASADVRAGDLSVLESPDTTHFTIVDDQGNVVTNTYTLNDSFGSGVVAKGTGFLLNNEMDDFAAQPGKPNLFQLIQGERNAIAPKKRPLSSMTPTIVLRPDGSFWFALGSPGGPRIINAVLQVILNIVDHGMDVQQAIDSPRIHQQWLPDLLVYERYGLSNDTIKTLQSLGHNLSSTYERATSYSGRRRYMGDVQAIMIEKGSGIRLGASDPRGDGAAAGY